MEINAIFCLDVLSTVHTMRNKATLSRRAYETSHADMPGKSEATHGSRVKYLRVKIDEKRKKTTITAFNKNLGNSVYYYLLSETYYCWPLKYFFVI